MTEEDINKLEASAKDVLAAGGMMLPGACSIVLALAPLARVGLAAERQAKAVKGQTRLEAEFEAAIFSDVESLYEEDALSAPPPPNREVSDGHC